MNLHDLLEIIEAKPTPSPQQFADARTYVTRCAPDLVEAIFGGGA